MITRGQKNTNLSEHRGQNIQSCSNTQYSTGEVDSATWFYLKPTFSITELDSRVILYKRYLKKSYQIAENQSVESWQPMHYVDATGNVLTATDTFIIEVVWNDWFMKFTIPEFQQWCWSVWLRTSGRFDPLLTACLQRVHFINIAWHSDMKDISPLNYIKYCCHSIADIFQSND